MMELTDWKGTPKIVKSYDSSLTGRTCVSKIVIHLLCSYASDSPKCLRVGDQPNVSSKSTSSNARLLVDWLMVSLSTRGGLKQR